MQNALYPLRFQGARTPHQIVTLAVSPKKTTVFMDLLRPVYIYGKNNVD